MSHNSAGAVDISSVSGVAGSVLLFDTLFSVIFNDPSISSNASIASMPCPAVLTICIFLELFLFSVHSFHYMYFVQQIILSCSSSVDFLHYTSLAR